MFKTFFNIVLVLVGLSTFAHAHDFQLLNNDLEPSISLESSDEIYKISFPQHLFFDLQSQDFNVVYNAEIEPFQPEEISNDKNGLLRRSYYLSSLQVSHLEVSDCQSFCNFYLRATLFPFHSFW